MARLFSTAKERNAYKNKIRDQYFNLWKTINHKYDLKIPESELFPCAESYGKARAKQKFFDWGSLFDEQNIFKTLGLIISSVVSITLLVLIPPAGMASWQIVALSLSSALGSALGVGSLGVGVQTQHDLRLKAFELLNLARSAHKDLRAKQSVQITQLLIYQPYAHLANGELYKRENPGARGFQNGLEAPNPMKGINGNLEQNPLSDMLSNTAHKSLAGNIAYDGLALNIPRESFQENTAFSLQAQQGAIKTHSLRIQKGINELVENYFGFDDTSRIDKHYNASIAQDITPRVKRLNDYMFLVQNAYYQRAEPIPRFISHPSRLHLTLQKAPL